MEGRASPTSGVAAAGAEGIRQPASRDARRIGGRRLCTKDLAADTRERAVSAPRRRAGVGVRTTVRASWTVEMGGPTRRIAEPGRFDRNANRAAAGARGRGRRYGRGRGATGNDSAKPDRGSDPRSRKPNRGDRSQSAVAKPDRQWCWRTRCTERSAALAPARYDCGDCVASPRLPWRRQATAIRRTRFGAQY